MYTCSIFCHLQGMQLWTPTTFLPSPKVPILMSTDCPMLSTACWHTNNHVTTITKRQHAPKKHTHKKHILLVSIVNQEGDGGSAGCSRAASEVELASVPQSSISYLISIGTGISSTQLHNQPFRTIKLVFFRLPRLVFDGSRGRRAAKRSRATELIQRWQHLDSNMTMAA